MRQGQRDDKRGTEYTGKGRRIGERSCVGRGGVGGSLPHGTSRM